MLCNWAVPRKCPCFATGSPTDARDFNPVASVSLGSAGMSMPALEEAPPDPNELIALRGVLHSCTHAMFGDDDVIFATVC